MEGGSSLVPFVKKKTIEPVIQTRKKRASLENMDKGQQEEGQVKAPVADDSPGEGDDIADEEETGNRKKEAAKEEAGGGRGTGGEARRVGSQQGDQTIENDQPDQEQFDGKNEINGLTARSRQRLKKPIEQGGRQDMEEAAGGWFQYRQIDPGVPVKYLEFHLLTADIG